LLLKKERSDGGGPPIQVLDRTNIPPDETEPYDPAISLSVIVSESKPILRVYVEPTVRSGILSITELNEHDEV
jgi:hypothetical protein